MTSTDEGGGNTGDQGKKAAQDGDDVSAKGGEQWGTGTAVAAGMPMAMGGYYNPYFTAQGAPHMMPGMVYGMQQHGAAGMGSNPYGDILSSGTGAGGGTASVGSMGGMIRAGGSMSDVDKAALSSTGAGKEGKEKQKRRKRPKDKPKRPLSAYNIFFKEERARILSSLSGEDDAVSKEEVGDEKEEADGSKEEPNDDKDEADADNVGDERAPKKAKTAKPWRKKKPHGKIGFESLAKTIGSRWKDLSPERLEYYKKLAEVDSERYARDMEEYGLKIEKERGKEVESSAALTTSTNGGMGIGAGMGTKLTAKDEAEQIAAAVTAAMPGDGGTGDGDDKDKKGKKTKKKRGRSKKSSKATDSQDVSLTVQTANSLAASNAFTAAMGSAGAGTGQMMGGMNPAMMGYTYPAGTMPGMGMGMANMPYGGNSPFASYGYGAPGMDASGGGMQQGYGMMAPMGGMGGGPDGGQAQAGAGSGSGDGGQDVGNQGSSQGEGGGVQSQGGLPNQQFGVGGFGMGIGDAQGNTMTHQMATEHDGGKPL